MPERDVRPIGWWRNRTWKQRWEAVVVIGSLLVLYFVVHLFR